MQDIAHATGISSQTVRSQIKALFVKTQTHRQPELVGLLTRVAMISEGEADIEAGADKTVEIALQTITDRVA